MCRQTKSSFLSLSKSHCYTICVYKASAFQIGMVSSRFTFSCCLVAGVCLGMQVAVIEFARNILGWKDAHSTEFNSTTEHPVVIEMPEHNTGHMGATMRLGKRKTVFKSKTSLLSKLIAEFVM